MMYEIKSPGSKFTGILYGMTWTNGTARTEDSFTAARLKSKGYTVKAVRTGGKK